MSAPEEPKPQSVLHGRWEMGPRLGQGGQGRTFLARDLKTGKDVVAKELKLAGAGWKRFDLFEREVKALGQINHPGVPKLLDHFEEPAGTFWVVMEKAAGATLRAIATKVKFTESELADVLKRVLEILVHLHGRTPAIIHRDVKPANLLRAADGSVMLVDFGGVAAALREDGGSTVVGTFGYMAPEQLHGASTPQTDLYGLGATIVSLAGGVEPEKVPRRGLRMDLDKHLPQLSRPLRSLLAQLTDPDPDERPESAAAALKKLEAARDPTPLAPVEKKALATTPEAPPPAEPEADDGIFDVDDRSIPIPLRVLMRMAFFALGVVGGAALFVGEVAFVPFVFALIRAFTAAQGRPKLRAAEKQVRGALREGREGFARLRQQGLKGRKAKPQLPGAPSQKKLPGKKK
jgi:serine/threonine protein kinase